MWKLLWHVYEFIFYMSYFFFFFQAEDGIRDIGVTGVQTCALPIFEAVMGVERGLLLLRELAVGLCVGGVLDLVLRVRDPDVAVGFRRVGDRDERDLGAEQARLDGEPFGPVGVGVEVDLFDRADLLAVGIDGGLAAPGEGLICVHGILPGSDGH